MKTFALIFVITFAGCAEKEAMPTVEERLQGAWRREWTPAAATTNYSFDGNGQCITYAILPSQPIQQYVYHYTTEGDVLTMTDLATSHPFQVTRSGTVMFSADGDTAVWNVGIDYVLIRI